MTKGNLYDVRDFSLWLTVHVLYTSNCCYGASLNLRLNVCVSEGVHVQYTRTRKNKRIMTENKHFNYKIWDLRVAQRRERSALAHSQSAVNRDIEFGNGKKRKGTKCNAPESMSACTASGWLQRAAQISAVRRSRSARHGSAPAFSRWATHSPTYTYEYENSRKHAAIRQSMKEYVKIRFAFRSIYDWHKSQSGINCASQLNYSPSTASTVIVPQKNAEATNIKNIWKSTAQSSVEVDEQTAISTVVPLRSKFTLAPRSISSFTASGSAAYGMIKSSYIIQYIVECRLLIFSCQKQTPERRA